MSNLIYIQDQPIINLEKVVAIAMCDERRIRFVFGEEHYYWEFANGNQALVALEAIRKARCSDLGKFDFTGAEVKDIYDRIN